MVLESTMVCIDDSEYMRNGDFIPTRLHAQQEAVGIVCQTKTRSNPENSVGLLTLSRPEVLSTLTSDVGRIISKLHQVQPNGKINFLTGIRIAHLALKHRQGKNHKMRMVIFVGSPIDVEQNELLNLAKRLKKEKVNVDVINFGEDSNFCSDRSSSNSEILASFVDTINGKEGSGSHLVTIPQGPNLTYALMSSPILQSDGVLGLGGTGFEFGVDPNEDPELALALRMSVNEQRQHQEESRKSSQSGANEQSATSTIPALNDSSEEDLLEKALTMSLDGGPTVQEPDFAIMTEDEQLAYAMQMSLQQSKKSSNSLNKEESMETDSSEQDEDYSEIMNDPEFLQSVLQSLPGVNPQSESIRKVMRSLNQDCEDKKKDNDKKKRNK